MVLPAAVVRSPREARRTFLACPVWTSQQTPPATCASDGATSMLWGLRGVGHRQAAPGIYWDIAAVIAYKRGLKVVCCHGIFYSINRSAEEEIIKMPTARPLAAQRFHGFCRQLVRKNYSILQDSGEGARKKEKKYSQNFDLCSLCVRGNRAAAFPWQSSIKR